MLVLLQSELIIWRLEGTVFLTKGMEVHIFLLRGNREAKGECGGRGAKGVGPWTHVKDFPPKSKEGP